MKLEDHTAEFEGSLPKGERMTFQLKSNPRMFQILSDGIYSDKISAVVRELSCNAFDSNKTARSPRPFTVNVPTALDPSFWVEDTGLGIDPAKIVDIFWTYGSSTKVNDLETIGALGLGSKSPFAYTKSSFLVVNRYNGIEYKYFCFINEHGIPDGKLIQQNVTAEPNGVRVELAVRTDDISTFYERIVRFFSFWDNDNLPTFTGRTDVLSAITAIKQGRSLVGRNWSLRSYEEELSDGAFAVMGGVPYPIDRDKLGRKVSDALISICKSSINIIFPIGTLSFAVSREELSYDDRTVKALEDSAGVIISEMLGAALAKAADQETPFALYKVFHEVHDNLRSSFPYVADIFRSKIFKLKDGREYSKRQMGEHVELVAPVHLPFDIRLVESCVRSYSKGTQRFALMPKLMVKLIKPEERAADGSLTISAKHHTAEWFKLGSPAMPHTNLNRKRTTANLLHEGYASASSVLQTPISTTPMFIINDIGERGSEGLRFHRDNFTATLHEAYSNNNLFFVDGFVSGKTVDEIELELKAFFTNSLFEGAPVMKLSDAPNFKLPEPVKADTKPRAPIQRGTIEQRIAVFDISKTKTNSYNVSDFEVKLPYVSGRGATYRRHDITKPMLYLNANWGTPLNKELVTSEAIAAFRTAGLLDAFLSDDDAQVESVQVAYLSPNQVDECIRRKIMMVNLGTLHSQVEAMIKQDTVLVEAMQSRLSKNDDEPRFLKYLTTKHMMKHMHPMLSAGNKIVELINIGSTIKTLVADQRRAALLTLTHNVFNIELATLANSLAGTKVRSLLELYPLLSILVSSLYLSSNAESHQHIGYYIRAIDARLEEAVQAKKLNALASLHAEALFESL